MNNKLDKIVEQFVLALDPNANQEIIQEAQKKANEVFNPSVSEFLDQIEITIKKKQE